MSGLLDIILGYDCNVACTYCTITEVMRARALPAPAIAAELSRGRGEGFDKVSFTGGEPTIRADLLPLVRRAAG
ncbi:MAG: radical SAM protein, partial [Nannocystaceae bacterium]|nr:radical SAM protein [Nannocystaceae bacterium]